jgi:hypothetical protein
MFDFYNITEQKPRKDCDICKKTGKQIMANGGSIVDYLNSTKKDSSFAARERMAASMGISGYTGSAAQNTQMLRSLRSGTQPVQQAAPVVQNQRSAAPVPTQGSAPAPSMRNTESVVSTIPSNQVTRVNKQTGEAVAPRKHTDKVVSKIPASQIVRKEKPKDPWDDIIPDRDGYVNLSEMNIDPLSKQGIEIAQRIAQKNPKAKFICTAGGCAEIARKASHALGYQFNPGNAWEMGNKNIVTYQTPDMQAYVPGSGVPLPDPKNFQVDPTFQQLEAGYILGLNRNNNRKHGKAPLKALADDSYDYVNPEFYPQARGYEHVGLSLGNNTLLHGTASPLHPSYYVIDNMSDGVNLEGYGKYQPVEAIRAKKGKYTKKMDVGGENKTGPTPRINLKGVDWKALSESFEKNKKAHLQGQQNQVQQPNVFSAVAGGNLKYAQGAIMGMNMLGQALEQKQFANERFNTVNNATTDATFATVEGNRGDYDINSGFFRPDQHVATQFKGMTQPTYYGRAYAADGMEMQGMTDGYLPQEVIPEFLTAPMMSAPMMEAAPQAQAPQMEAPQNEAAGAPSPEAGDDFRQMIIAKESGGNYAALPKKKDGTLASSAVGAYQFLWNSHKKEIAKITGVTSKEEFRRNPKAQDKFFAHWDQNVLTPTAQRIKAFAPNVSLNQIKAKVHFAGPKGAIDFFAHGKETVDGFGTKTSTYAEGGEYDLSPDEIMNILANGGEIEFV